MHVGGDRYESLHLHGNKEPWRSTCKLLRTCGERSNQEGFLETRGAVQLGRWQAGFPRSSEKDFRWVYAHAGILEPHRRGFKPQFPTCELWDLGKLLHLSELWYPAHRAIRGLNKLVHLKQFVPSLEHSRCSINGSG